MLCYVGLRCGKGGGIVYHRVSWGRGRRRRSTRHSSWRCWICIGVLRPFWCIFLFFLIWRLGIEDVLKMEGYEGVSSWCLLLGCLFVSLSVEERTRGWVREGLEGLRDGFIIYILEIDRLIHLVENDMIDVFPTLIFNAGLGSVKWIDRWKVRWDSESEECPCLVSFLLIPFFLPYTLSLKFQPQPCFIIILLDYYWLWAH